jgi:hypothetical protein
MRSLVWNAGGISAPLRSPRGCCPTKSQSPSFLSVVAVAVAAVPVIALAATRKGVALASVRRRSHDAAERELLK